MPRTTGALRFGVEEEFLLVDPDQRTTHLAGHRSYPGSAPKLFGASAGVRRA
ncbi:hypothetical protein [Streptomyces sp. NRRL WC-3742]|uniref:hypothetical protein n=1 Tax=Streptomyces sp. NRRL WC-3742 TaxID=1463934 RepID=UPI000A69C2C7|nr:hypothetical protein [Streptomyces sp. NRRL WC-3742]